MLWVGPDTRPEQQRRTTEETLIADRQWQSMLKRGQASVITAVELDLLIRDCASQTGLALPDDRRFVLMVHCWRRVTAATALEQLTRPDRALQDSYDHLSRIIADTCNGLPELAPLVDGIWALLRSTALLRRSDLSNGGIDTTDAPHAIQVRNTERHLFGPLQPFEQYYRPARTCRADRWQAFLQELTVENPRGGYRWVATKGRGAELTIVCPKGHRMNGTANTRHNSFRSEYRGCAVCSGRSVLAGFNSLHDRGITLRVAWHPTRNGTLTPSDVMPHTERKVWWVCPKGHEFESKVAIIAAARLGCPICRGYRVESGVNDLATLRPDIAGQWHPTKNLPLPDPLTLSRRSTCSSTAKSLAQKTLLCLRREKRWTPPSDASHLCRTPTDPT